MANGVIATYQATDNYYVKPMIDFMLANNEFSSIIKNGIINQRFNQ